MTYAELPEWFTPLQTRLSQSLARRRLPHAVLWVGGAGLGADEFLSWWAGRLLCHGAQDAPCGQCRACRLLAAGTHSDLRRLEPVGRGQNIGVDQVRALIDFAQGTAQLGPTKLAVLHQADRLNDAAANALLKILEEPPDNTYLVLSTALPQRLLPTIRSRLQTVRLPVPDRVIGGQWLAARGVPETDAESLLRLHNGAVWAALDSYEQGVLEVQVRALAALEAQLDRPDPFLGSVQSLASMVPEHVLRVWQVWCHDMLRASLARRSGAVAASPSIAESGMRLLREYPAASFWADVADRVEQLRRDQTAGNHYNWRTLLERFWIELGRRIQAERRARIAAAGKA